MAIVKVKKASGRVLPVIAGTRIKVSQVYREHVLSRMSPSEIAAAYPTVTLAEVYEALAYAFAHIREIRKELREEHELFQRMKKEGVFANRIHA